MNTEPLDVKEAIAEIKKPKARTPDDPVYAVGDMHVLKGRAFIICDVTRQNRLVLRHVSSKATVKEKKIRDYKSSGRMPKSLTIRRAEPKPQEEPEKEEVNDA